MAQNFLTCDRDQALLLLGLGGVVGDVAVKLDVEEEALGGPLRPELGLALGGDRVEARVQLHAVKAL